MLCLALASTTAAAAHDKAHRKHERKHEAARSRALALEQEEPEPEPAAKTTPPPKFQPRKFPYTTSYPAFWKLVTSSKGDGKTMLDGLKKGVEAPQESHVIDFWKTPLFNPTTQVLYPQSLRDKCTLCQSVASPRRQLGMNYRWAPDLTNGAPNLYEQQYLEAYQIEMTLKRCPMYHSETCYEPDGFAYKMVKPCPDSLMCSACMGIPLHYCLTYE